MSNLDEIHIRVRELRKRARMSQQEFADTLGYSRNYVSQIEIGNKKPAKRFIRDMLAFEEAHFSADSSKTGGQISGARGLLKKLREEKGWSIADLSMASGIAVSVIERLENTGMRGTENLLAPLAVALGTTVEQLKAGSDTPEIIDPTGMTATYGTKPKLVLPAGMKGRYVPLLASGEAGPWDAGHTDGGYDHMTIFALNVDDRRAFAIKVSGNSMEPALNEGDIVICSPAQELHNGEAAVVRTHSDQVFIKYWRRTGDEVKLESANPAYKAIDFPVTEIAGAWPIVQRVNAGRITKQL